MTLTGNNSAVDTSGTFIDARGPRFGAVLTSVVLALALVTHSAVLIALQLIVFAIGAFISPTKIPYSFLYKKFVKPRLKGEVPLEDVRPPKFAQLVGFLFAATALAGSIAGSSAVFTVAVGLCLAASFLNAAFNFCLGCQIYLLSVRFLSIR
jgi:hypothetical protein